MGRIEVAGESVRLWIVYSATGKPLQLFKGTATEAVELCGKAYPSRAPLAIVEAVDCPLADVQMVVALAHGEWVSVQFQMLAQAMNPIQPARMGIVKH